jgi:hypothetical protein
MIHIHEAVYKLNPSVVSMHGDIAYDSQGNEVIYDKTAAQAEFAANQYKPNRAAEYPSLGDQLDALFHAGVFPADMAAKIQAVKDKYPKE